MLILFLTMNNNLDESQACVSKGLIIGSYMFIIPTPKKFWYVNLVSIINNDSEVFAWMCQNNFFGIYKVCLISMCKIGFDFMYI